MIGHRTGLSAADFSARLAQRIVFRRQLGRGLALGLAAGLTFSLLDFISWYAAPRTVWQDDPLSLHVVLVSVWAVVVAAAYGGGRYAQQRIQHAAAYQTPAMTVARAHVGPDRVLWKKSVLGVVTAVGILGPLSLHALLCLPWMQLHIDDFWVWGVLSVILTSHVHAIGVFRLRGAARALMANPAAPLGRSFGGTLLWTTLAALVPGVVLLGIPPMVVLATGLVVYGASYAWLARVVRREARFLRDRRVA